MLHWQFCIYYKIATGMSAVRKYNMKEHVEKQIQHEASVLVSGHPEC